MSKAPNRNSSNKNKIKRKICQTTTNDEGELVVAKNESEIKCENRWWQGQHHRQHQNHHWIMLILVILLYCCFGYTHGVNIDGDDVFHTLHSSQQQQQQQASSHFRTNTKIRPKIFHGIHNSALNHTEEEAGLHATHLTLKYAHDGKFVIVDLKLNDNLIPKGHFVRYQSPNGDKIIKKFTKTDVNLCHYHGKIRGNTNSHAAVSTCNGIRGIIFDGHETFYIENDHHQNPSKLNSIDSDHILYKHSDMIHTAKCGYDGGINKTHDPELYEHFHKESEYNRIHRIKRSLPTNNQIRGPYNANKHSSYVELLMVIDNKVYKSMGEDVTRVHRHCKDIVNIINGLYMPLNIFVALIGVVIWTERNEVELSNNGDTTLKNFLHYRKKILVKEHPNDNAQLLTKETFDSGVVGKALKGPICTYEFSGGVSIDHSTVIGVVATTVAHEMGHNFGMEHDTADCKCVDEKCIMSASSSSVAPRHWSQCSIDQLNLAFHHGMNHCLKNKPEKLFDGPVCGNDFVEPGEECDCGLPQFCENTCCDPNTCRLRANATCATGHCCDLNLCHAKEAGTICRSADTECDLPEFCDGSSEYCPSDVYKRDSELCGRGKAYCYQGTCRTQSDQCRLLWGPSGSSTDQCYVKNEEGTRHGNCGYDRFENEYIKCKKEDTMCGMVHCRHLNERLEFGMESVAVLSHSFMNHMGSIIPCRTAVVDLGLEAMDPGLTPDGAKCGENKMCVNQTCRTLESLAAIKMFPVCPHDCNGHGTCNSNGNCHCEIGFSPPFCDTPGSGGSLDSGPASDPDAGSAIRRLILIFFLGVVPTAVIAAFLIYYYKQNNLVPIRKAPTIPTHKQNKQSPARPPQSPPSFGSSTTPNSPDDMSSALLKKSSSTDTDSSLNNNMFGKFKGFSLKPLPGPTSQKNAASPIAYVQPVAKVEPVKKAPSIPKPPSVITKKSPSSTLKSVQNFVPSADAPALPPLNPGQGGRPIISNPILENSTCNRRELDSPLKVAPVRPAPPTPEVLINPTLDGKKAKEGPLHRITSFLKKENEVVVAPPPPVPKPPVVTAKPVVNSKPVLKQNRKPIDRERLKTIDISGPIPIPESKETTEINRTQSMRYGRKRPTSIVERPTLPPPRPPSPKKVEATYQNPPAPKKVEFAPTEEMVAPLAHISEESSPITPTDNIYDEIAESPSPPHLNSTSTESMGLLGEIVSEIENRNCDAVYIASTLRRGKAPPPALPPSNELYINTAEIIDKESDEEYMTPKSATSTTSSGYMRPMGYATPVARVAPTTSNIPETSAPTAPLSSFKSPVTTATTTLSSPPPPNLNSITFSSPLTTQPADSSAPTKPESLRTYKPYHTTINRPGPYMASIKAKEAKEALADKKPSISRTVTPPTIKSVRTRTPSPKRPNGVTSPDLINSIPKTKQPDVVVNRTKPKITQVKPATAAATVTKPKVNGTKPGTARKATNVASLQQKFESSSGTSK